MTKLDKQQTVIIMYWMSLKYLTEMQLIEFQGLFGCAEQATEEELGQYIEIDFPNLVKAALNELLKEEIEVNK